MSSDTPRSATEHRTRGEDESFKKSFKFAPLERVNEPHTARGKITGCPARPPNCGWQMEFAFCAANFTNCRKDSERKCGWSPSTMAQLEMSFCQPCQFAAQTIELNIPRSGCGFSMRSDLEKFKRSSSAISAASSGRSTTAICAAPTSRHCDS